MCEDKIVITEDVKSKLEKKGVVLNESLSDAEIISNVNKSNVAVARYDEKTDKVVIKESLNG